MPIKPHASMAVHPGPWLRRNVLAHYAMTVTKAAAHLGVTRVPMSNLLNGHSGLSAEMAIRFEKAFGISADTLIAMQTNYDMVQARAREGEIKVVRFEIAA